MNFEKFLKECSKLEEDDEERKKEIEQVKKEKIMQYGKYWAILEKVKVDVLNNPVLNDSEKSRFVTFLNSAKWHCKGKINVFSGNYKVD